MKPEGGEIEKVVVDFLVKVPLKARPDLGFPSSMTFRPGDRAILPRKVVEFWLHNGKAMLVSPDTPPPGLAPPAAGQEEDPEAMILRRLRESRTVPDLVAVTETISPDDFDEPALERMWQTYYKTRTVLSEGCQDAAPRT